MKIESAGGRLLVLLCLIITVISSSCGKKREASFEKKLGRILQDDELGQDVGKFFNSLPNEDSKESDEKGSSRIAGALIGLTLIGEALLKPLIETVEKSFCSFKCSNCDRGWNCPICPKCDPNCPICPSSSLGDCKPPDVSKCPTQPICLPCNESTALPNSRTTTTFTPIIITSLPRSTTTSKPITTPLPTSSAKPTIVSQSTTTNKPTSTPQPGTTPKPNTTLQPGTSAMPTSTLQPATSARPTSTPQPSTTPKPNTTLQPGTSAMPTSTLQPATSGRPTSTPQPGTTPKTNTTPQPTTSAMPTSKPQPSTTNKPTTSPNLETTPKLVTSTKKPDTTTSSKPTTATSSTTAKPVTTTVAPTSTTTLDPKSTTAASASTTIPKFSTTTGVPSSTSTAKPSSTSTARPTSTIPPKTSSTSPSTTSTSPPNPTSATSTTTKKASTSTAPQTSTSAPSPSPTSSASELTTTSSPPGVSIMRIVPRSLDDELSDKKHSRGRSPHRSSSTTKTSKSSSASSSSTKFESYIMKRQADYNDDSDDSYDDDDTNDLLDQSRESLPTGEPDSSEGSRSSLEDEKASLDESRKESELDNKSEQESSSDGSGRSALVFSHKSNITVGVPDPKELVSRWNSMFETNSRLLIDIPFLRITVDTFFAKIPDNYDMNQQNQVRDLLARMGDYEGSKLLSLEHVKMSLKQLCQRVFGFILNKFFLAGCKCERCGTGMDPKECPRCTSPAPPCNPEKCKTCPPLPECPCPKYEPCPTCNSQRTTPVPNRPNNSTSSTTKTPDAVVVKVKRDLGEEPQGTLDCDSLRPTCSLWKEGLCGFAQRNQINSPTGGPINTFSHWPSHIRLEIDLSGVEGEMGTCSGALISHQHVITAAGCVKVGIVELRPKNFKVVLGERRVGELGDGELVLNVSSICVSKKYYDLGDDGARHDFAVLTLSQPVAFSESIQPACLPYGPPESYEQENCHVVGVGLEKYAPGSSKSSVQVRSVSCSRWGVSEGDRSRHCFSGLRGLGDTCGGGAGGPVLCAGRAGNGQPRWLVAGLVSYSAEQCARNLSIGFTGVFSKIPALLKYIVRDCAV